MGQVRNYLKYRDILYSKQFGFRGLRGCDQALLLFTDFAKSNIFENRKVLTAFLDLRKAFDTVNQDKTNPRYHICNSWNNLPFMVKASQPDYFLDDLRCHFNSCNDQPCTIDKCWVCGDQ